MDEHSLNLRLLKIHSRGPFTFIILKSLHQNISNKVLDPYHPDESAKLPEGTEIEIRPSRTNPFFFHDCCQYDFNLGNDLTVCCTLLCPLGYIV